MGSPLFSVGITTYNRPDFLREAILSVLNQGSDDIEVIVGNDFVEQPITNKSLDIFDDRLKIINHPQNLGELPNMNFLLRASAGKYFLWLADDDLLLAGALELARCHLKTWPAEKAIYPAFTSSSSIADGASAAKVERYEGQHFLRLYLERRLPVIGCYGIFDRDFLISLGGMRKLSAGISPYSDNLIALEAATLPIVAFSPQPSFYFRVHPGSLSNSSSNVEDFQEAQLAYLNRAVSLWSTEADDLAEKVYLLSRWMISDFLAVWIRQSRPKLKQIIDYWCSLRGVFHLSGMAGSMKLYLLTGLIAVKFLMLKLRNLH